MFSCTQCPGVSFAAQESLRTHCKISRKWHPYCWKCDLEFAGEDEFDQHISDEHCFHRCFYCPAKFNSEYNLEQHTLSKHARYRCNICDEGFETKVGRNRHYRVSSNHPNCIKCGLGWADYDSLEQHEYDAHLEGSEAHLLESQHHPTCSHCLIGFENTLSYEHHNATLHPESSWSQHEYDSDTTLEDSCDTFSNDYGATSQQSKLVDYSTDSTVEEEDLLRSPMPNLTGFDEEAADPYSEPLAWRNLDEDSSSETDVQWTPALSDYESATDEDESQQYLEYSEYHLHTNSPAWAALFPLPDSPETVADDLPQCAPEITPTSSYASYTTPESETVTSANEADVVDNPVSVPTEAEIPKIVIDTTFLTSSPTTALNISPHEDICYSPVTNRSFTATYTSNISAYLAQSPESPSIEETNELPSSPTSLLDSEWSNFDSLNSLSDSPKYSHPPLPIGASTQPSAESESDFGSESPREQDIPFQFSDSIFAEQLSEDVMEVDADWEGVEDKIGFVSDTMQQEPVHSPSPGLHCRICPRESCEDLTATMCGHIFCNSCITEAVMANSRCPVCSAPTLLYCLFRLDLSV